MLFWCGEVRREVKHLSTCRNRYSVSSGERKRRRLNRCRVILCGGCGAGVVGSNRPGSVGPGGSYKEAFERNRIGCLAVEGDGPVRVGALPACCCFPSSAGLVESRVNLP